ncbi:MAG: TIGR00730 family Rossman fold protein [Muribaculaceae bacterium]|nr:TIGR00730 family Rossman fold protein [Muribaculaceae bacterium]
MNLKNKIICIFCASSPNVKESYRNMAYELGRKIAQHGAGCICGAGKCGLMAAITEGALSEGGNVTGVIPQFMVDNNWQHPHLSELIITSDMHSRKSLMAKKCDAIIALPGGVGTFEELLEAITWRQLGIISKPIVILNHNAFYNPLLDMFSHAIEEDFMKPSHNSLWKVVPTIDEALSYLENYNEMQQDALESKY